MAAEKVPAAGRGERGGGAYPAAAVEMMMMSNNGNSSNKVAGAGAGPAAAYRWNGDAVPLKRRRVGLSNGGSVSDAGSGAEEDEEDDDREDEDVAAAEELSDEEDGEVGVADDEDDEPLASMNRGGGSRSRGLHYEPVGFDDHEGGTEDDGFEEETAVPDSPVVRSRGRERARELSSPEEGREVSDDSDEERTLPAPRGFVDRGQASANDSHREMRVVPEKAAKGMMDTAKRKVEVTPRNGGEPKPKKARVPSSSRRKSNGEGTRERARFNTDNKARVTLERAREILASVKAAMMKDPKQFAIRHTYTQAVGNSSSSDDERVPMHLPPSRVVQQVKTEEKVVKKRSRPPKVDKAPAPRRRKPKVEIDHGSDEKYLYRKSHVEGSGREHPHKFAHFSASGAEVQEVDTEGYERKESRDDGYEQHIAVAEKKVRKRRKPKETEDGPSGSTGLCPGSVLRNENWEPPPSPFGLIQESLYKDPWKVLLSCMLLNKTAGRQMHKVIWDLFGLCPDAATAISMDTSKIAEKIYSLGLQNKRAKMIQRFSLEYLRGDWTNVTQLHGIGKYAADAYAIFCQGLWREVEPDDLMLSKYWKWLWDTDGMGSAFTPDTS